jgi:hypothetical protein
MLHSIFVSAGLAGLVSAAGCASAPAAAEAHGELNIGFALYTKGEAPGTLDARWRYTNESSGSGWATGGLAEGFAGRHHVRYFDEDGKFSDEYDLIIERSGDFYNGSWITNGKVSARGVGMKVANGVAIGWRRVADWP